MTTHYDNVNNNEKVKKFRKMFNDTQSDHINNVFKNSNNFCSKATKKITTSILAARINTDTNNFIQPKGPFKRTDKRCKICSLYVNEDNSFVKSNYMKWEFRSHVTCRDINVIYYLKSNMCDIKKRILGKRLAIMLLVLKVESINILVTVEQVFTLVNFPYTYIIVP